jgi:hypothetical protein
LSYELRLVGVDDSAFAVPELDPNDPVVQNASSDCAIERVECIWLSGEDAVGQDRKDGCSGFCHGDVPCIANGLITGVFTEHGDDGHRDKNHCRQPRESNLEDDECGRLLTCRPGRAPSFGQPI